MENKEIQNVVAEFLKQSHVKHTLKLVPGTQRELFISEIMKPLTQLVKEVQEGERQRLENEFGDFAHEHYKGCTREENDEYTYGYDSEVIWLVRDFFEKERLTPPTSNVTEE